MKHKQLKRTFSWLVCLTVTALFIYLFINWHTVTSTTKELDQLVATNPGSALAKLAELPVKEKNQAKTTSEASLAAVGLVGEIVTSDKRSLIVT